jgi:uncharacterized protein YqjF (DUF2071 family)
MPAISEYPTQAVKRPVMFQAWQGLTFLHWPYQPDLIRDLLPSSLELDTFDGVAWIGLTPFLLTGLRASFLPTLPWISCFPEMNVRTYVRASDGERGIWFFSLEAARLLAVAGARLTYGLPYRWASMRVRFHTARVEYSSRRYAGRGRAHIVIRRQSPIQPNACERFLTARFRLYTKIAGRLAFAQIEHDPWPLESAGIDHLEQDVIQNSSLPSPEGEPLVHFSPGVYVRIGRPTLAS